MKKKAQFQIPGATVDIYAYVTLIFVILLFFILFQIKGCEQENSSSEIVQSKVPEIDSKTFLTTLLKTPILVDLNKQQGDLPGDFKTITFSELIILYKSDNEFKSILEKNIVDFLDYQYNSCSVLCIDQEMFFNKQNCNLYISKCNNNLKVLLPNINNKLISVTLNLNSPRLSEGGT